MCVLQECLAKKRKKHAEQSEACSRCRAIFEAELVERDAREAEQLERNIEQLERITLLEERIEQLKEAALIATLAPSESITEDNAADLISLSGEEILMEIEMEEVRAAMEETAAAAAAAEVGLIVTSDTESGGGDVSGPPRVGSFPVAGLAGLAGWAGLDWVAEGLTSRTGSSAAGPSALQGRAVVHATGLSHLSPIPRSTICVNQHQCINLLASLPDLFLS